MVSFLLDKPEFYCSHDFSSLYLYPLVTLARAELSSRAPNSSGVEGGEVLEAFSFVREQEADDKLMFLRVEAREPWLMKGAWGTMRISHGLSRRPTLIDELRDKLEQACDGEPTVGPNIRCRGEAPEASSSTDDPMAQVAEDEVVVVQSRRSTGNSVKNRKRYYMNNLKNKVLEVSMPERARETGIDEGDRMVRLYCEDRQKLWLCTKDADWALRYLRDQLSTKGVIRVAPGDRGPGARPVEPVPAGQPVVAGPLHLTDDVQMGENQPVVAGPLHLTDDVQVGENAGPVEVN